MAHAAIFEVIVESWSEGKTPKPRVVTAICKRCKAQFRADEAPRTGEGTFASYLGAIHLRCPQCGAEGPVPMRRLKAS